MRRIVSVLLAGVLALGACSGDDRSDRGAPPTTTIATLGWNPDALATARAVADDVVATGTECNDYAEYDFPAVVADYRGAIPVPLAMTQCKTEAGEDLTFEVFGDAATINAFIAAKRKLICESAAQRGLDDFPGFSYVRGPTWLIEPDEVGTAEALAPQLDRATSNTTTCEGFAPPTTTVPRS